ncbi:MAG: NAD(P)H-dependent glycerol-3-phosphate dehydrogenase [Alphaproteobacteria bacterium]
MSFQKIGIVGAGAWGTGLAQAVRRAGRDVVVWSHNAQTVAAINRTGKNENYLPGITLDTAVCATGDLAEVAACDIVLLATPAQSTRAIAGKLAPLLTPGHPVILCAKGIEQNTHELLSHVLGQVIPSALPVVLSGPSFAGEVGRNLPAALTLACADEELGARLAQSLGHANFRLYWTSDLVGTQVGGAIKNVLAIAAGIVAGKQLGANAHAALIARGFAEMTKLGAALGARPETLTGLSGLGDLVLTCANRQSRNMSLGIKLGQGAPHDELLADRLELCEGVYTASAIVEIAAKHALDLPICRAVQAIVSGRAPVDQTIDTLLARPFRPE